MRIARTLALLGALSLASGAHAQDSLTRPETTERTPRDTLRTGPAPLSLTLPPSALRDLGPLDGGGGSVLTLELVLASVARHHPTLAQARLELDAAEGEQLAAEGGFDPTIAIDGSFAALGYYRWGQGSVTIDQPTPLWGARFYGGWRMGRAFEGDETVDPGVPPYYREYETLDGGELRVGARVPLWRDGPIDARRRRLWASGHERDAREGQLGQSELAIAYEASVAYWQWVAAGRAYRIVEGLLALAEARDGQIRARVAAGDLPSIDALENRRVVLARRRDLVSARRDLEQTALFLSLFLRDGEGRPVVPGASRLPDALAPSASPEVALERAIEETLARHPLLARYAALVRRNQVYVQHAENRAAPRIDVGVDASFDLGGGSDRQVSSLSAPVLAGSVRVEVPLLLREMQGETARERATLAALREEARLVRDRIAMGVRDAGSALAAAEERLGLAREASEVAAAVAEGERRRFELGETQLFVVNLREQQAAEAERARIEAEASWEVAQARWRLATGTEGA